jgi:hypothetical protein
MKRFRHSVYILPIFAMLGWSQVNTGTVVIVGMSKEKIIIAADSRLTHSEGNYDDDGCKIATFGNKLVFAETGLVTDKSEILPKKLQFDAIESARDSFNFENNLFNSSPPDWPPLAQGFPFNVASQWSFMFGGRFMQAAQIEMDNWLKVMPKSSDTEGFIGIFAGLESDGSLGVTAMLYGCKKPKLENANNSSHSSNCDPIWDGKKYALTDDLVFVPYGITDIASEFINRTSQRAEESFRQWQERRKINPDQADWQWANRLVDLTIAFSQDKDFVHGPISVVQIDRGKNPTWLQNPNNCPEN